jgi:hypothetical protein
MKFRVGAWRLQPVTAIGKSPELLGLAIRNGRIGEDGLSSMSAGFY